MNLIQLPHQKVYVSKSYQGETLENFQKEIRLSLTSVCCTCECLCYQKGVSLVDVSKVHDVLQQHYHTSIKFNHVYLMLIIAGLVIFHIYYGQQIYMRK